MRRGGQIRADPVYPLTFGQEQLFLLEGLGNPGVLVFALRLPLPPGVSVVHVTTALSRVVRVHDALRMCMAPDGATQVVSPLRPVECLPAGADPYAYGAMAPSTTTGRSPLFFSVDSTSTQPILTVYLHHAFVDGWSAALISGDFYRHYRALLAGQRSAVPATADSFGLYAAALRRAMTAERLHRHMSFWADELSGAEPLALPHVTAPWQPGAQFGRFPAQVFELSDCTVAELLAGTPALAGSVSTAALAAFATAVGAVTGQRDLIMQVALADRGRHRLRRLVGCLVNLASLRLRLPPDLAPDGVIDAARTALARAARHQVGPFQLAGRRTEAGRVLNLSPRVAVAFNQEINVHADAALVSRSAPGDVRRHEFCTVWESSATCISDLHLEVLPGPPNLPLRYRVTYRPDLWRRDGIEALGTDVARWLRRVAGSTTGVT